MQIITKAEFPAVHLALAYLHIDNNPFPVPEAFKLDDRWDLPLLEAACGALSFAPLADGVMAHHPGGDVLDSELWRVVGGDEDAIFAVRAKYPQHHAGIQHLGELLDSCFEGDDSEFWLGAVRLRA